jgi:hypothetical protein
MVRIYAGKRWEISLGRYVTFTGTIPYLQQRKAEIEPDSAQDVDASLVDSRGRYSPIGLGSEIAAHFRGAGFEDGEIPELRGFTIKAPKFEE